MPWSARKLLKESQTSPPQVRMPIILPRFEAADAFAEGFTVGSGVFVAEDDDVAAEGVLHVREGIADARLPEEPGAAEKFGENPGVDVAAVVVADVDDEALAVVDGIEVASPFGDVVGAHGAKVDVADVVLGVGIDFAAAGKFPFGVAKIAFVAFGDGSDEDVRATGLQWISLGGELCGRLCRGAGHVRRRR